jgi:hypothetical protein
VVTPQQSAVPETSLVSTAQPDKKKACAEKTSNSSTCSATSAPSNEFRTITLRPLRATDEALRELQQRLHQLYAKTGRPSIAPEKLLRALLLQALYSVRSERMLMEELNYNLLFRWFVGLNMDDSVWDVTVLPRAVAGWGHCRSLLPSRVTAGTRAESALGRALHGGWNATGSVGECEELSTQGCEERRSAGRSRQCDGGLPRGEAVEECFGWLKTIALLRKVRHRGIFKVEWVFTFAAAAYNLVRMRNLAMQAT